MGFFGNDSKKIEELTKENSELKTKIDELEAQLQEQAYQQENVVLRFKISRTSL